MVQRRFHYDFAFERYLRANLLPYITAIEEKRALTDLNVMPSKLKRLYFVVYFKSAANLLVDVKGRKRSGKTGRSLHN